MWQILLSKEGSQSLPAHMSLFNLDHPLIKLGSTYPSLQLGGALATVSTTRGAEVMS